VTVLPFVEGVSDRQTADAVRTRIDWTYALRLPREDLGCDCSIRCAFRGRQQAGGGEHWLCEALLEHAKVRGRHRTDSTHGLAAIQTLSRLECVAETLRQALNALSATIPGWGQAHVPPQWYERSATRWQDYRLPAGRQERQDLAEMSGRDGRQVFALLQQTPARHRAQTLPAVETVQRVWVQQLYADESPVCWRETKDVPSSRLLICTPLILRLVVARSVQRPGRATTSI
jgi:transposase